MSLILDALNRSRQDESPLPGLATQHPVEHLTADRRKYLPWVALAVALLLIVWLVMERFSAPPVREADIGAPVGELSRNIGSAVASVTTELKARTAQQVQEPEPVVVETGALSDIASPGLEVQEPALAQTAKTARSEVDVPAPESASLSEESPTDGSMAGAVEAVTHPSSSTQENAAVAQLYQNRDVAEPVREERQSTSKERPSGVTRKEEPVDLERILQEAQEEVENARLTEHSVPFLSSLSQQTKDSIPTLYYQRHDYSTNASQSAVTLNGSALKVGGSPLPGMKVEEILPDSVVLSFQGTQFRLRALNSWINL